MWHEDHTPTKLKWLLAVLPTDLAPESILEIGCGRGGVLAGLHERFPDATLTGLDISEDVLGYARTRVPTAKFIHSDILSLNRSEHYDLVIGLDVLEHLYFHEEVMSLVRAISRQSIWHVPLGASSKNHLLDRWRGQIQRYGHIQFYDMPALLTMFARCGLAVRDYRYTFGLELPKYRHLYRFFGWAFRLSPYLIAQTIGLVSVMVWCDSVPRDV